VNNTVKTLDEAKYLDEVDLYLLALNHEIDHWAQLMYLTSGQTVKVLLAYKMKKTFMQAFMASGFSPPKMFIPFIEKVNYFKPTCWDGETESFKYPSKQ